MGFRGFRGFRESRGLRGFRVCRVQGLGCKATPRKLLQT